MTTFPFLMKVKEKHDNYFYVVNNEDEFIRVAYSFLKERYEDGCWYPTVERAEQYLEDEVSALRSRYDEDLLSLSEEEVESLPASLREKAVEQREKFTSLCERARRISENHGDLWFARNIERLMGLSAVDAIADTFEWRGRQVNTVKNLFLSRQDYQYEGFSKLDLSAVPVYSE